MHRALAAAILLCLASPTLADAPGAGTFGIGASLAGQVAGGVTMESGLNGRYFITDNLLVAGNLSLASIENVGTTFGLTPSLSYYFRSGTSQQLCPFVGGALGLQIVSISRANTTNASALLLVGGGLEYFVNRHVSAQVSEGMQIVTNDPFSIAFITKVGLNLYF